MIKLFEHNQKAYESAVSMLSETGKAAIVHPTGTGKSFIGFRLCEDNPDKTVCWLSPSEYIFKTQLENIKAICGYEPTNIKFYTYAKLMLMSEDEIAEIQPEYIILDEFHRCGTEMWGQGVQNLLNGEADIPILGLSATAIRYLDNQRDMADELFDCNIASEMTLGEAIVRGILNPPKYVQAVYSYQKDYDRYERRVRRAKNKAIRDAGERYLEAIRHAIEMADGLETVFDKHMTDRTGKYIIFCANKEHMDEMMSHTREWFCKIDKRPHVYSVYTEDASASKSFAAFKDDCDTKHLRLLYCIDALNEGIHVDDVNGVILLRPTISPIIYKQQIGRALSASKKKEPIIFDIVNNIDNLYSIGAVEEEMRAAITYYNYFGECSEIVNDRFKVFDEVKSCRELFEQLEDTLTTSWDMMFEHAKLYFNEKGNLDVPRRYKTPEGYSLGSWLQTQRKVRAGEQFGNLNEEKIEKLDSIGMRWESAADTAWQKYYDAAVRYKNKNGDLTVIATYIDDDGVRLGSWISNMRSWRKSGSTNSFLTEDRIKALDNLGMIWNQPDFVWTRNFAALSEFYCKNGHLDVPANCIVNGVKIGSYIRNLRASYNGIRPQYRITQEQIDCLNSIGMIWIDKPTMQWEKGFSEAQKYKLQNGDLRFSISYVTPDGYNLGKWLNRQISVERSGKLSEDRVKRLDTLDADWRRTRHLSWNDRYLLVKKYYDEHGNIRVPYNLVVDGVCLSKWLSEQKLIYLGQRKNKFLSSEQIKLLEDIGMDWRSKSDEAWEKRFIELKSYYEKYGDIMIPCDNSLGRWVVVQRSRRKDNMLSTDQIEALDSVGMRWEVEDGWNTGYEHARMYVQEFENAYISNNYICSDGYALGTWLSRQKAVHNKKTQYGKLSEEQIRLPEELGIDWDNSRYDRVWTETYELLKQYFDEHHTEPPVRFKASNGMNLHEWIRTQRVKHRKGTLDAEKTELFEKLGIGWLFPVEVIWERYYQAAQNYFVKYGNLNVPITYKDENGVTLGRWVYEQSNNPQKLKVNWANGDQKARLKAIGIVWNDEGQSNPKKTSDVRTANLAVL